MIDLSKIIDVSSYNSIQQNYKPLRWHLAQTIQPIKKLECVNNNYLEVESYMQWECETES